MPSNATFCEASKNDISPIESSLACDHILPSNFSTDLSDQLFCIQFTLDGIMRCPTTDDIMYEDRILIRSSSIPCSSIFIQWSALLPLQGKDTVTLVGLFSFQRVDAGNRVRQKVSRETWDLLIQSCIMIGILSLSMDATCAHTTISSKINLRSHKKHK